MQPECIFLVQLGPNGNIRRHIWRNLAATSGVDIYYRVKGSALFLLLTEFINIQTNGNPVMTIQTITILVIAIAKLDWRSATRLKLRLLYFYMLIDFIGANIIWLTIIWLTLTCLIWFRRRFLLTSRYKKRRCTCS